MDTQYTIVWFDSTTDGLQELSSTDLVTIINARDLIKSQPGVHSMGKIACQKTTTKFWVMDPDQEYATEGE